MRNAVFNRSLLALKKVKLKLDRDRVEGLIFKLPKVLNRQPRD